jgi:ribosomal protein S18 acetylase RimI-like enzyme
LIIKALNEWAKNKGITEIRLDVYDDNISALNAYEKAGFKRHLVNMRMRID